MLDAFPLTQTLAHAWPALALTLRLAAVTTVLLLLFSLPLAWWLARGSSTWRRVVESIVTLPLVLPPTVLGFYVLVMLGANSPLGQAAQALGLGTLAFSFSGLVLGSMLYSLPFAVQPLQAAFAAQGLRPMEVAKTLGAQPLDAFFTVALPQARHGLLTAAVLCFAHTLGEFGVVLMIGGNIPEQTQVLSTLIYGYVEATDYASAHVLAAGMVLVGFAALLLLARLKPRTAKP